MKSYELTTTLGPTASGKTTFVATPIAQSDMEIISADSRQIHRSMDIGTGKDLADYSANGKRIPYHLISICESGYKCNVSEYQHDFFWVYEDMKRRGKSPILCGGTRMHIEAVPKGYKLLDVPQNPELRESLRNETLEEPEAILASYKILCNKTDADTVQRVIHAIEIEEYYKTQAPNVNEYNPINNLIIGIHINRELRREKISRRLRVRLDEGMVDGARMILATGVKPEDLIYYGLEYKFLTLYTIGGLSFEEMVLQLKIAIHQFAKRQATWFRDMGRRGCEIHWIDATLPAEEKIATTTRTLNNQL